MDLYPGLDLGLKNLGAHLGFRYFFSDGHLQRLDAYAKYDKRCNWIRTIK
jgi:hypothetical protein